MTFTAFQFNRMYLISCFGVQAGYFDKSRLEITLKANTKFEEIPNEEDFGAIPVKRTLLKDFIEGQDYEYFGKPAYCNNDLNGFIGEF